MSGTDRDQRWASVLGRYTVATAEDLEALGVRIAHVLRGGDVVLLDGELGAGKTTLTRGIGVGLEIRDRVTSPTFVVARTHRRKSGEAPLVHVDAYRLGGVLEFDDVDVDVDASIVVVEWGAPYVADLADEWLAIHISRELGGTPAAQDPDDADVADPREVTITVARG